MNEEGYDYNFHRTIIYSVMAVVTGAGLFGNINLIVLHFRKTPLRTKYGILLCILTICQTVCVIFEWIGISYTLVASTAYRTTCFRMLFPFIFFLCMHNGLLATISFDLLLSVLKPLWHRKQRNYFYCAVISIPTVIYAVFLVFLGFYFMEDSEIKMCNPASALNTLTNRTYYVIALFIAVFVMLNYCVAYGVLLWKSRRETTSLIVEGRVLKSLGVILIIYFFARFLGMFITNVAMFLKCDPALIAVLQNYVGIFTFITYCQNFYVISWRSKEYRSYLKEQIVLGLLFIFKNSKWLKNRLPKKQMFSSVSQRRNGLTNYQRKSNKITTS